MKKKIIVVLLLMVFCMSVVAPISAFASTGDVKCSTVFGGDQTDAGKTINGTIESIIKIIAGTGGLLFTLAFLILSALIIFTSVSSKSKGAFWTGIISCFGGALLFFSCFKWAGAIALIAQGSSCT